MFPVESSVLLKTRRAVEARKKISVDCVNAEKHNVIASSVAPISL